MPSASDTTWRCRCIVGYFRDFRQDDCVPAPMKLFNKEKITCDIGIGIRRGIEVCTANLTSTLSLYTTEIAQSMLRPQTDLFELKVDNSVTQFKLSTKVAITEVSTFVFVLHATLKVDDSIGSVNVSDVIEINLNFIQSDNLARKYFTYITEDTLPNQIVYRIPTENFKNPGSMIITGTNLFKLRSSSGIVHTDKFIGDELSSDEIGKEIIATIENSRNGDTVAYLYVIIMRSEYKIELGEGIDPDRIIGTFSFISQNISITIDGVSNNIFYTTGLNLYRGNFEFDFDGDSNQREHNFNSKVNAPSYVTDSFNGELISKVVIRITDKNDQAPIFLKPTYEIPLLLSALSNVLIGFVTAEDNDTIGQLSYQIEQKYQSYFKINDIGAITTAVPVNALLNITGFNATTEILPIKVMATDGVQTATSTVLIQITSPPNENLGLTFKGYILEGEPIGTNITSIYESGYTNYQFIQINEGEKYFKLNATSGNVKSNMEFDRETKDEIKIVVMATKEGALSCSISVLGELVVTVLDINDNAPVFTQSEYQGSVIENSADAVISMTVDVKATDADIDENANVKYFLKNHQTVFNINETTAEIRTITGLDRESISEYILTVVATDGEKNGTADVVISVLDVNDNSPSFNTTYSLSVSEDTSIDTSVGKVTAADPDAGKNSKLVYYIIGGGGYFQIERYTGEIFVKHALDRETDTSFKFIVSARDDGDNPRSSAVNVTVTITDVNDNAPSFNESSLQTSLNEDVDCATSLHMVAAYDLDDGTNKEIQFQILSETDKFAINSTTGIITCKLGFKIDYENTTRYEISVEAKDKGNQPKSSTATVVIEINDVNDNDPVFIGDFAGGVKHISLSSAIFQGSVPKPILVIPVEDIDSGSNGAILLEVSGDFIGFVSTDSQTKLLQTKGGATPMTGEYTLNITAKDQGIPSRQTVASLIIEITSTVNIINKVTFTQENIRLEITEEQASLTYKYSNITDFVINKNGKQMKYSILTAQDDFAINEAHGQLSVNKKLDRETKPGHFFVVRAENTMNSDDSDLGLIKITVVDINDNPPVFKKKKYIYLVEEDVNINYVLSSPKIEASDADDPGNTHFVFKIKITDDCAASFQINEQTGVISVQAELDYEKWSICRFDVELTDSQSSPINTASVEVDVNVLDVNDHSPEFDGSTFLYQVHVGEDAKIGDQIVSTARVTDADDRGNGDIILKMVDDVDCFFTVEKALEGEKTVPVLKVKTELDYEKNKSSTCIVIAEDKPDRKQDVRSASATFSISILDVNDNPPIVSSRPDEIEIERDIAPNTEILTHIAATDKDSGINAKLKYILDENLLREYFRINENTGAIATKYSLALLQKDVVKLHIKIEDSGTPTLSTSLIVRIIIKDANFRPKFNSTRAAVSLKEEHEINGDIFIATAYDIVEGKVEKCNCTYRLQSGNEYFTIVNNTGIVRMLPNRVLDRENRKTILVLIIARDHDVQSPKDSEYLHLTVTVTDINDQSPVFNTDYAFNILQVAPVGTIIGKISADDKDEGINAVTYYSVENVTLPNEQPNDDSRRLIRIDIFNGTLFLNEVIDVNASHDFVIIVKVKAKDSLDDNKIGYTDVRLNVIFDNPNKHQPTCKNEFTRLNVLTAKENSTIVFLNASDSDTGINGEITFTIIDGNFRDIFSVDSRTGEMKLNYALNKAFVTTDVPDQFHIVIQIIDKGIVHKTGTCTISIEVDGDPEQCVEQSKLQEEQQIFIYSMSAIAVVLALFILLFLYCTYKYCTSKKYMHENDRSSPTIPYKPTFPDINKQNQFKQDFEPSNYTEDNISDIFGYEVHLGEMDYANCKKNISKTIAFAAVKSDEPIPDYDAEADNTSEEVDFEQLRKQERARSFKRSESSRKDRHKQIYGEDKDRKRPQDFLRNKKAKFMKKRNDDSFAFGGSDWDMSTKRFSNI
ncbi:hypothetical protein KUTeg_015585 [Tegillarca granosa]|uniref:Cadherin domain-containing protein n=1 Tax=Tegillarca granosa TaxID=220873 RepID=A0ABQ9ET05_TEGGR|nr:hypothetical protein KUTeg_015585 [Tegillarca granosa]